MLKYKNIIHITMVIIFFFTTQVFAWERYYGTDFDDDGRSVDQAEVGYIIGGTTIYSENDMDAYLANISDEGDVIWSNNYGVPESLEIIYAVRQTMDGNFIAVGEAWDPNAGIQAWARGFMVKIDYAGNEVWR